MRLSQASAPSANVSISFARKDRGRERDAVLPLQSPHHFSQHLSVTTIWNVTDCTSFRLALVVGSHHSYMANACANINWESESR